MSKVLKSLPIDGAKHCNIVEVFSEIVRRSIRISGIVESPIRFEAIILKFCERNIFPARNGNTLDRILTTIFFAATDPKSLTVLHARK